MNIKCFRLFSILLAGILTWSCSSSTQDGLNAAEFLDEAALELKQSLELLDKAEQNPRYLENESLHFVPSRASLLTGTRPTRFRYLDYLTRGARYSNVKISLIKEWKV